MAISGHRCQESLRNYIGRPSREQLRACSDILSEALSERPRRTVQPSLTALSSRKIFIFRYVSLGDIRLNSLFSNCHLKKNLRVL